jgi:endosialidase-like protein
VSALAGIRRIRGVSWRWREDTAVSELAGRGGEAQAGVIAQEVQAVFPDLVVEGERGYLMVDYAGLAQMLVRAVEELRARTDDLERRSATSLSDEGAKAEIDPLAGAMEHLREGPGSLTSEDVQALVGALVEAVKALDARVGAMERAAQG